MKSCCLACALLAALSVSGAQNEAAIREVQSGRWQVAEADWWGFDPADATKALQAAINSGAARVVVRPMDGPWIVGPIQLAGDQEVVFEPGVEVLAKAGAFHGANDSLFTATGRRNVRLTGPGATLRMRRADYAGPPYAKAEWRHVLNLRSCTNVIVTGLTLAESGGDGIYLGVGRSGGPNRDIVIRNVVCDGNYRQGISVISAENLLLEDCVLKNTAGTPPAAGIDFEPNRPGERLVHCVMRRCVSENNQGLGYHFYLGHLGASSLPVSIRLEECVSRGTNRQSLNVYLPVDDPPGLVRGVIEFVKCRFEDHGRAGMVISKPAASARVRFRDCVLADSSAAPAVTAPIVFRARAGMKTRLGGVEFHDFTLHETTDRPLVEFDHGMGVPLAGVSGTLIRRADGRTEKLALDDAWLASISPPDPFFDLPVTEPDLAELIPPPSASGPGTQPPHRLRGASTLALSARAGEQVRVAVRFQPVGRAPVQRPLTVQASGPSGRRVRETIGELGQETVCEFTAAEGGVHRLHCDAGTHTVTVSTSSHALALLGQEGVFHFVRTAANLLFRVTPAATDFGVRLTGGGGVELVKARLFDPAGTNVWAADAIDKPRSFVFEGTQPRRAGWWRLQLEKPFRGVFEDHYVEIRGVPAILWFAAETAP